MTRLRKENKDFPGGGWLRFRTPTAGSSSSIPGQGASTHELQLRPGAVKSIYKEEKPRSLSPRRETLGS